MPVNSVFLLPGQGGYTPALFADTFPRHPRIKEILDTVDRTAAAFGRHPVSTLLTRADAPTAADLTRQDPFALQLAVFAAGVGGYHLAQEQHGTPDVVVGHSMGEIAALTVAGAFTLADGARLTALRAQALAAHCPTDGGLLALELNTTRTTHLLGALAEHTLALAVVNAPRQSVVSGPAPALDTLARAAAALDIRTTRLNAPYPFHNPLLHSAAQHFTAALTDLPQHPLRLRVHSPVAGTYLNDTDDLKALLARQLTAPVHFLDTLRTLHADGAEHFTECGKAGLTGLVRRTIPQTTPGPHPTPTPAPVPAPSTTPAPAPVATPTAATGSVLEELRELYAGALGYPVEVVTGEADLEADLGVDSLKRAEMLGKVAAHFGLGESARDGRFVAQSTLADLAALIETTPTTTAPASLAPAAPVTGSVLEELRELYAGALGYPVEVVTGEADLEADLGVDSLKRAEMLGKVAAHFGLGESARDGRFVAQSTLADLAALVTAAQTAR
ncbi:hypothetical protein SLNWT_0119 [Streptomyces albus]|uniref:Carrier domain-containing protein n=1 Tax=Streptomyces albus (strain ATCC 21838 / DSM 41398 / FERM P-419 / JCM 4703 / NBRC 107858) TaxID=1081613 RepID=A0A0B5EMB5_STRA4|nr:hypothetical protein SLNWT_0119 [Streptomyces albus]AOU74810.1 hypothetical protein SLNHY_0119 [Streptomyces albus]AYN30622.1 hypothetical protein DUI70_0119 [Streptomyces albus]